MTNIIENFLKAEEILFDYFGYEENWKVYPVVDSTECFWVLEGEESIRYADNKDKLEDDAALDYYEDTILHDRFLKKWRWISFDLRYSMYLVDTQTDGNKFLAIFDNFKQVIPGLKEKVDG